MKTIQKLAVCAALAGAVTPQIVQAAPKKTDAAWKTTLAQRLPLYGHRNWVVIVDSAYPAQSSAGIETIMAPEGQTQVVREVLARLKNQKHIKPIVYTDAELRFVPEKDAPGINAYRQNLRAALGTRPVRVLPHEDIIAKLDGAGKAFRVLIIKTPMTLPYTSVFLELDCAYWNADAEKRMRASMKASR